MAASWRRSMQMRGGKHRPGEAVVAESLRTFPERSVGALLRSRAERFGDKEAVRFRTRSGRWQEVSFPQLRYLCPISAGAVAEPGLRPGEAVRSRPAQL